MLLLVAFALALVCLVASVVIHYEGISLLTRRLLARPPRHSLMISAIFFLIVLHFAEIMLWGGAYWLGDTVIDLGDFQGGRVIAILDYFYFSAETYTSLGLGDIVPTADLRVLCSVEVLTGLILLGWSGSFTFLLMSRNWRFDLPPSQSAK